MKPCINLLFLLVSFVGIPNWQAGKLNSPGDPPRHPFSPG